MVVTTHAPAVASWLMARQGAGVFGVGVGAGVALVVEETACVNGIDGAVARCEERRECDGGGTGGEAGSCALLVHNKLCNKPITNLALCTLRDVALLTKHGASASRRLPCVVQSAPAKFYQRQEGPSGRRGRVLVL